jgi:phosphoserine phosphatase
VFDNDGTLWSEQPMYVQLAFVVDRIKAMSNRHPEWKDKQPYKAVQESDIPALTKSGKKGLLELVMATHAGMSAEEFTAIAADWIKTAKHPTTGRPYTEMIYQPMLELLAYLRANGFKTFIVSGGGIEFMRPWTEATYGIPPEQVVGSSIKTKYEVKNGKPTLIRLPEVNFVDDKAGKPVGIYSHIGRRPIAAFGNSDGDFEMLEWTTAGGGARLGVLVHHDDAAREVAYDRKSHIGKLDRGLDEAPKRGWAVISMKDDWKRVFKFQ